jgi:hypothetical protein
MKASARILVTATTLATLTMLGLAAIATASVPKRPQGPQHPTTVEPTTVPQPGHGAQLHHDAHDAAPATGSQPPTDHTTGTVYASSRSIPALAVALLGLFLALAGATWLSRRRPPPAAV